MSNRVAKIYKLSKPTQWSYVHTERNPADIGTRSVNAENLERSMWLKGPPDKMSTDEMNFSKSYTSYDLQDPEKDHEGRPEISCNKSVSS